MLNKRNIEDILQFAKIILIVTLGAGAIIGVIMWTNHMDRARNEAYDKALHAHDGKWSCVVIDKQFSGGSFYIIVQIEGKIFMVTDDGAFYYKINLGDKLTYIVNGDSIILEKP